MPETIDRSFLESALPFERALRVHCYRMLGSSSDSEDMVQETLLRAWRARETLEDPSTLRPWLYRIATNVCLDELKRRPRRALASETHPPADPLAPYLPSIDEPVWLEPMPDTWIEGAPHQDPAARYTLRESVALAFVAAVHVLSPMQRATLLLRDVVGLSAEETASALGVTVSAANSALFRAREAVDQKLGGGESPVLEAARTGVDEALVARYIRAFEDANIESLVELLHAEVKTTMPPSPTWISGRQANETFYRKMVAAAVAGWVRVLPIRANGQPAFAFYRSKTPGAPRTLAAIQLVDFRGGLVASIDHFLTPRVFPLFGLPSELGQA